MKSGRVRPPGAPQPVVAVFLALAVLLTQAYRAWAHCTLTVTASPAKVCVGEETTVTQSGVDCLGQSVNVTNQQSFGSPGQHILCPSPACGGCGIDNCATVMVVAISGIVPTSATLCAGSSNTFSITITPPGETLPGGPNWTVTPAGAGNIVGSGTSVVFVAANTGVMATVTAGCGSSSAAATVTILTNLWGGWTVSNAPTISVTVSGEVASCASTTATFTAAISTNNGLRYRSDMNGCAPTNEVSDLVLTNLVTTWNVTGPNAASGSGTQAMFTVSNPGTNMITFTTTGETLDPAGTYSTDAVATNVSYSLTLTPLDTNTCVHCTNYFVATAAPAGSGTFTWNPAGVVTDSPDGTVSSNAVIFTTAGLAQLVSVSYGGCTQTATANVFEVTGVAWEAINSPLTANDHPSGTVGVKMFPDKNTPTDTVERRTVRVVATVNPPTNGIPIYFRVLDVDDPSTNAAPVDANDTMVGVGTGDDNRSDGTAIPVGGSLSAASALTYYCGSGVATASVVLTVSRQPGNNFRVAASCETNSLARLTVTNNVPDTLHVPGSDAAVSGFTGQITPLLTVWRRLHVELDSMAAVTGNNMTGNVTEIRGSPPAAREVSVDVALRDGSPDLDNVDVPSGLGRFENGRFLIASPFGATETLGICCNGASYIQKLSGIAIPFRITKPGLAVVTGQVWRWDANSLEFHLAVTAGNLTGSYRDGTFEVGGVAMEIRKVKTGPRIVEVKQLQPFGCVIHDDDDNAILLQLPDTGLLQPALADTYVTPKLDTAGIADNNQTNVLFRANVQNIDVTFDAQAWQSRNLNQNDFWVTYILNAFPGPTHAGADPQAPDSSDNDPYGETDEVVVGRTVFPDGGSIVYRESIRDSTGNLTLEERLTVVHEVGHAVGASIDEIMDAMGNLIGDGVQEGGRFLPQYQNSIRSSHKPVSFP